jgi:hypothetical protein
LRRKNTVKKRTTIERTWLRKKTTIKMTQLRYEKHYCKRITYLRRNSTVEMVKENAIERTQLRR